MDARRTVVRLGALEQLAHPLVQGGAATLTVGGLAMQPPQGLDRSVQINPIRLPVGKVREG
jgi:hypothetical protein